MSNTLSGFFRNIVFSYGSKIVSIVLGFIYFYIVANYLGPQDFGTYSFLLDFFSATLAIFGFNALFETATVFLAKTESHKFYQSVLKTGFFMSVIAGLIFFLYPDLILQFTGKGTLEILQGMSLVFFFSMLTNLLASILMGVKKFGKILKLSIIENTITIVLAFVSLQYLGFGLLGVIYSKAISLFLVSIISFFYVSSTKYSNAEPDMKEVEGFFGFAVLINILKKISIQTLLMFITTFIDPIGTGLYYLTQKISYYFIETPLSSLNNVLLPMVSKASESKDRIYWLTSVSIKFNLILSLIFCFILAVSGELFVQLLFPQYLGSGILILLFAAYFLLSFDLPLGNFFRAINRNDILFISNFVYLIVTAVAGYFIIPVFGAVGIVFTLMLSRISYILCLVIDLKMRKYKISFIPTYSDLIYFKNLFLSLVFSFTDKLKRSRN